LWKLPEEQRKDKMRRSALFVSLILISFSFHELHAQREIEYKEYPELLNLYMDGEYEEIIKKAEEGTMFSKAITEEHRRQPLPYIYLAKAYYEISKIDKYKEEYSRAFKQALKFASRFVERDEKNKFVSDHERFLAQLRRECMEVAKMHYEKGEHQKRQYRKARYFYKKMQGFSPGDPTPYYMEGFTWIKQGLERQAERPFKKGNELYSELDSLGELKDDQQEFFKFYVKEYSRYLLQEGMRDSAQTLVKKTDGHFRNDEEFMEQYEKVMQ
jgi:tetratricopeptide (TPR) repeat protein